MMEVMGYILNEITFNAKQNSRTLIKCYRKLVEIFRECTNM